MLQNKFARLWPVKRATYTEFVAKSRTTLFCAGTFRYLQQPYLLQVWFVGGKIRNIAFQPVQQQCRKTICTFLLSVFPYPKLCLNLYVRYSCPLYDKNSLKHSRQTTHFRSSYMIYFIHH